MAVEDVRFDVFFFFFFSVNRTLADGGLAAGLTAKAVSRRKRNVAYPISASVLTVFAFPSLSRLSVRKFFLTRRRLFRLRRGPIRFGRAGRDTFRFRKYSRLQSRARGRISPLAPFGPAPAVVRRYTRRTWLVFRVSKRSSQQYALPEKRFSAVARP